MLGEDTAFLCDRRRDRAGRIRIPGEFELAGRPLQLFAVRRGAADERLAARAAPKIPNGAAAPRVPATVSTERREKARRFASGTTFDKLLLSSCDFMASSPLCCLASVLLSPRNSKSPMQVGPTEPQPLG